MAKKNNTHILALDLAERSFKLVQRDIVSGCIDAAHIEPVESGALEDEVYLIRLFRAIMRTCRRSLKTRDTLLCVPSAFTFIRIMDLDPAEQDLPEQIRWEMDQQTLGQSGHLCYDWMPMMNGRITQNSGVIQPGGEADREELSGEPVLGAEEIKSAPSFVSARYLVAATGENRLKPVLSALRKSGLNPLMCDVDVLALANVFIHTFPEAGGNTALIADLSGDRAILCLVENGHYIDSDLVGGLSFRTPDNILQSVRKVENRFLEMLALHASEKKDDPVLYLAGELVSKSQTAATIISGFGFRTEIIDPFLKMNVTDDVRRLLSGVAPSFAVAAGLSLRKVGE